MRRLVPVLILLALVFTTHPVKAATTTITYGGFGNAQNTFTKNFYETTRTIVIVYEFEPWTSNTVMTYITASTTTTGTYTINTITTTTVWGTGTFMTSFISNSTTTIIVTSWYGTRTIVSQIGYLKTAATTTITLKIYNSYSFKYTTTATVVEYLTTIIDQEPLYTTTTYSSTSTGIAWLTNYTLATFFTETRTTKILTIVENGVTNVITYGDYGGRTEITTTLINRTLGETTITTTVTGTIDGAVEVRLDGYVDSQYYSTSTITVNYHYIAVLTTTPETTAPINQEVCYVYISWIWFFGYYDGLQLWFNGWYIYIQF